MSSFQGSGATAGLHVGQYFRHGGTGDRGTLSKNGLRLPPPQKVSIYIYLYYRCLEQELSDELSTVSYSIAERTKPAHTLIV